MQSLGASANRWQGWIKSVASMYTFPFPQSAQKARCRDLRFIFILDGRKLCQCERGIWRKKRNPLIKLPSSTTRPMDRAGVCSTHAKFIHALPVDSPPWTVLASVFLKDAEEPAALSFDSIAATTKAPTRLSFHENPGRNKAHFAFLLKFWQNQPNSSQLRNKKQNHEFVLMK